jgi:hypothetical protein
MYALEKRDAAAGIAASDAAQRGIFTSEAAFGEQQEEERRRVRQQAFADALPSSPIGASGRKGGSMRRKGSAADQTTPPPVAKQ